MVFCHITENGIRSMAEFFILYVSTTANNFETCGCAIKALDECRSLARYFGGPSAYGGSPDLHILNHGHIYHKMAMPPGTDGLIGITLKKQENTGKYRTDKQGNFVEYYTLRNFFGLFLRKILIHISTYHFFCKDNKVIFRKMIKILFFVS